jgi:stress-induced morphogen
MIHNEAMRDLIRQRLPDALVEVVDLTGTMDHFSVVVSSRAFAGIPPMDRHRMVEAAVAEARADGRIHALSIRTEVLK